MLFLRKLKHSDIKSSDKKDNILKLDVHSYYLLSPMVDWF